MPEAAYNLKCNLVSDKTDKEEKKMLVAANDEHLYHGVIGEGYSNDLLDTYIAIRNKKTNKVCNSITN